MAVLEAYARLTMTHHITSVRDRVQNNLPFYAAGFRHPGEIREIPTRFYWVNPH